MAEGKPSAPLRVVAAGKTDVGRRRDHNEDNILLERELRLYVVADGMGGHNAGEVASALTARSLENFFAASIDDGIPETYGGADDHLPLGAQRLRAAVRKANADVYEIASTRRQHKGMGSTVVAAHVADGDGRIYICHVGDSRCYRLRDGEIEQLTRDHSLVNDALAMRPDLTEDILAELPANVITRAVGTQAKVEVDIRSEQLAEDDLFLLCSDGLSGLVSAEQIADVCGLTRDLDEMCELLIVMANEAGGSDNISAIAIRVESAASARASSNADVGEDVDVAVDVAVIDEDEAIRLAAEADGEPDADAVAAEADGEPDADAVAVEADGEPDADAAVEVGLTVDLDEALPAGAEKADGSDASEAEPGSDEAGEEPSAEPGEAAVTICTECGNELVAEMAFCVECGTRVEAGSAAVVSLSDLAGDETEPVEISEEPEPESEEEDSSELAAEESPASADPGELPDGDDDAAEDLLEHCPQCGVELLEDNLFCVECGTRLDELDPTGD